MVKKKQKPTQCFLCGRNGNGDPLEKHHIFGGANRWKSERYGLYVYLCANRCHRESKESVHRNKAVAAYVHEYGQRKVMSEQGWSVEDFVNEFGRNYI